MAGCPSAQLGQTPPQHYLRDANYTGRANEAEGLQLPGCQGGGLRSPDLGLVGNRLQSRPIEHSGLPNLPAQLSITFSKPAPCPMGSKLAKGPQQGPSRERGTPVPSHTTFPHPTTRGQHLPPRAALTTQLASQVTQRLWAYKSYGCFHTMKVL